MEVRDTAEKLTVPLAIEHKDLTQMGRLSVGDASVLHKTQCPLLKSISQGQKDSGFDLSVPLEI